jgi:nitroreductase
MMLTNMDFAALVEEANLAPSVHNTQPSRWRLEPDGRVLVLEDPRRRLPVGDPLGRDADVSHGAAIEGFALACAAWGAEIQMDTLESGVGTSLRPVARLTLGPAVAPDPLRAMVPTRRTYRGAFVKAADRAALSSLSTEGDVRLIDDAQGVARLAQLNDEAGLRTFRDGPYRAELLSWMRLSPKHPRWASDGLNAEAMEMSGLEAAGAGLVLRPGVFEALDRIGVARAFVAEAVVVRSAQAVALFHRPASESPLQTGRRFYRLWLEFEQLGLSAAPMAVLADDVQVRSTISTDFGIPPERRLVTAFRLGPAPSRKLGPKPRLPVAELLA